MKMAQNWQKIWQCLFPSPHPKSTAPNSKQKVKNQFSKSKRIFKTKQRKYILSRSVNSKSQTLEQRLATTTWKQRETKDRPKVKDSFQHSVLSACTWVLFPADEEGPAGVGGTDRAGRDARSGRAHSTWSPCVDLCALTHTLRVS